MPQPPPSGPVEPGDDSHLQDWLDRFGVTAEQLQEAVSAAGNDALAVAEHLLHQGGSAGAG